MATEATSRLVEFYNTGVSRPQLHEGVYDVTLKSHELVAKDPKNPYIRFTFVTKEGRELSENKFDGGIQIMISHLKQQLNRGDEEVVVLDFLNSLVADRTEFKIWITKYVPARGQSRMNFNFLEPRKPEEAEGIEVEDAI